MPAVKTTPPSPKKGVKQPAGPPLDYCFMDIASLDHLSEVKPVGGFVKGQPSSAVQPNKAGTSLASGSRPATANAESEAQKQPVQQPATSPPKPVQYERNSLAIKLANNPLTSLAGLPEAAAAILDEPCKLAGIQEELTRFPKLQMLYLHANQITKLNEIKKLGKLPCLQKLTLHGNPVAELPHYKVQVLSYLPQLRELDFVAVSKLDRDTVNVWMKSQHSSHKT